MEETDGKIVLKVAQIFYKRNSQIFIVDERSIIEQMAIEYAVGVPDHKINVLSPYSEKRYVLDKEEIVAFIVCDPSDIEDNAFDDDDEDNNGIGLWAA